MFFTPDLTAIRTLHPRKEFHYWSPKSEAFASASHLYSAILRGWQTSSHVIQRTYTFGGGRHTHVYYIELRRDRQYMTMPVIENPALIRLLALNSFEVSGYQEHIVGIAVQQRQRTRALTG
ncbi:MAG: hypothetical protein AAFU54_09165 [Chloroflexota bacterium]